MGAKHDKPIEYFLAKNIKEAVHKQNREVSKTEKKNNFSIKSNGKMFLDGVEIKNVKKYKLTSSVKSPAELTIKMDVRINQIAFESEK